jgi:hypothetical protein
MVRKSLFICVLSFFIVAIGVFAGPKIAERITPLIEVLNNPSEFMDINDSQSVVGNRLKRNYMLSGRLDIWRAAFVEYKKSPIEEKFFGLGFNIIREISYKHLKGTGYAHNEYLSSLIETGVFGLLGLLIWIVVISLKLLFELKYMQWETFVSIPVFFSTLVIAMGTMPFRSLRAVLVLGIYTGIALYNRTGRVQMLKNKKLFDFQRSSLL